MRNYIISIATLLACAPLLHAQTDDAMSLGVRNLSLSYEDPVYGTARYSAMAGARMALGEDISATRENPAGLGLYMKRSDLNITPDFNKNDGGGNINVSSFGAAFRINNNHKASGFVSSAVGITYHRVRNYANELDFDGGSYNEGKSYGLWSASYGMNVGNRYFFGVGANVVRGHYLQKTKTEENETMFFDSQTRGFNLKTGAIIKLKENFNVALAFHSPTRYNIEESAREKGEKLYDDAEYHQWGPLKLEGGIGWYIKPEMTLSFDYSYQDFRAINVGNRNDYFNDVKDYVDNNMTSCHTFKLGFEAKPLDLFRARLGAAYVTSPTDTPNEEVLSGKNINYAVVLPKETLYICAGLGYEYKWAYADLAYVFKKQGADLYKEINSTNNSCSSESVTNSDILLTIGVHF